MEYTTQYSSPIGQILLASDGENLTGLWIENQKYFADTINQYEDKNLPVFGKTKLWLDSYFNGEMPEIDFPLKPKGSAFRQMVWKKLLQIPYGETVTYGEISKKLKMETGKTISAQAVGGAVGHNPISIIIPCHRVVGANGNLTGYAAGIDKKKYLLDLERTKK